MQLNPVDTGFFLRVENIEGTWWENEVFHSFIRGILEMGKLESGVYENCAAKHSIFANACLVFDMGCGIISPYVISAKNHRHNPNP